MTFNTSFPGFNLNIVIRHDVVVGHVVDKLTRLVSGAADRGLPLDPLEVTSPDDEA